MPPGGGVTPVEIAPPAPQSNPVTLGSRLGALGSQRGCARATQRAPAGISREDSTMQLPGGPLLIVAAPSQKLGMSWLTMY